MSSLKQSFFGALYKSIDPKQDCNFLIKDDIKAYYEDKYRRVFKQKFDDKRISSLELNQEKNAPYRTPICSLASSGRLAFLFFEGYEDTCEYQFEKALKNDIGSHTKMDVYVEREHSAIYYECKCQEILGKSHGLLRDTYSDSELFSKMLGKKKPDYKPRKIDGKNYMVFNLSELGISIDAPYNKLHFDVKQLICHLIAIAMANKEKIQKLKEANPDVAPEWEAELRYVIFKPDEIFIDDKVRELYEKLEKEIECIKASKTISKFCELYHIKLIAPCYKPIVKECNDNMYKDAFLRDRYN